MAAAKEWPRTLAPVDVTYWSELGSSMDNAGLPPNGRRNPFQMTNGKGTAFVHPVIQITRFILSILLGALYSTCTQ